MCCRGDSEKGSCFWWEWKWVTERNAAQLFPCLSLDEISVSVGYSYQGSVCEM